MQGWHLNESETPWPPHVGDLIQIVATGAPGMVIDIDKSRRFVVAIYSHEMRAVTTAPLRSFSLREIGPTSAPPVVDAAAVAPPRRGARAKRPAE